MSRIRRPDRTRAGAARRRDLFADWPVSSCDCRACRAACTNSPGWFRPAEVSRLAAHLGLSVEELFRRRLAVGVTRLADGSLRHGVMPHKLRDRKRPGQVWSLAEMAAPGRCVFFDRGRCAIYAVRPCECARMSHERMERAPQLRRLVLRAWTAAALAPYERWTGRSLRAATSAPVRKEGPR
jgi:Fe-S-cluster containining protein